MSSDIGHRCSLDPALLWLWHRPAAAAPIGPLAQDLPYADGYGPKKQKKKKKKKKEKNNPTHIIEKEQNWRTDMLCDFKT